MRVVPAMFLLAMLGLGCTSKGDPRADPPLPGAPKRAVPVSDQSLTGAGSTFVNPLMSRWIADYGKLNPGAKIDYQSIGSGGGIRQIIERTVDFAASDAPLTDEQLPKAPGLLHVPLCLGAVVLIYNLEGVPSGLELSPDDVAGIFLGRLQSWDDEALKKENPDAKLPSRPVAMVHRSDGSGTTRIFVDYLAAVSPEWKKGPGVGTSVSWPGGLGAKGNEGVTAQVKLTPGAVGYVELSYAIENKLTYAAVKNKAGQYVLPSVESTTSAGAGAAAKMPDDLRTSIVDAEGERSYPIAGITYALVYTEQKDAKKGRLLAEFLKWAVHDGQATTAPLNYGALPAAVVEKADKQLAKLVGPNKAPLLQ